MEQENVRRFDYVGQTLFLKILSSETDLENRHFGFFIFTAEHTSQRLRKSQENNSVG
jgi:hypothetical protein